MQQWPVGPPWFIWLLFAFDGVAVLLFNWRKSFYVSVGNWLARLSKRPVYLSAVIYGVVAISLIPLSLWVGQYTWVGSWGPFDFQLNRLLFYLVFFLLGSCLGATDWQNYLFSQNRLFGRDRLVWLVVCLGCFLLFVMISRAGATWVKQGDMTSTEGYFLYDIVFVASCLASTGACISFFKQSITHPLNGWNSLSANAYGIYVVHYGFVTWLQFALLSVNVPAVVKFVTVFLGALSLSWLSSRLLRRSAVVSRVL